MTEATVFDKIAQRIANGLPCAWNHDLYKEVSAARIARTMQAVMEATSEHTKYCIKYEDFCCEHTLYPYCQSDILRRTEEKLK